MSTVVVPTVCTVSLKHFKRDNGKCWMKVYGSQFFAAGKDDADWTYEIPQLDAPFEIQLPFRDSYTSKHDYFFVWIYTQQHHDAKSGELKLESKEMRTSPVVDRTGTTCVSIHNRLQADKCYLYDIQGNNVGYVICSIPQDPAKLTLYKNKIWLPDEHPSRKKLDPGHCAIPKLCKWTETGLQELHAKHFSKGSNITQYLPRYICRPVQQHCGPIPMWTWPLLRIRYPASNEHSGLDAYLQHAERNARFLLNLPYNNYSSTMEICEVLGEMQTLPARAMQYVLDQSRVSPSKTIPIDDWNHPHDQPIGDLMSGDCEDFALLMLQEAIYLKYCTSLANKTIARVEKGYLTFLCAMTLRLPGNNKWTYHLTTVKLDRAWVIARLFGKTKLPSKDNRQPAMLLEGTSYTTSCWDYKQSSTEKKAYQASSVKSLSDCETMAKIPPARIKERKLYGHILTLFGSEELWNQYGICQIELGQDEKFGASVEDVMNYEADNSIQWVPLQMVKPKQVVKTQRRLARLAAAYPLSPVPHAPTTKKALEPPGSQCSRISCCMRYVDWLRRSEDVHAMLALQAGDGVHPRDIQAVVLDVNDRQKIVYLHC
jgi:hypothetical protein